MADSANAIRKSEPGCGCDLAGADGEMCPEGVRLAETAAAAYRRLVMGTDRLTDAEWLVQVASDVYDRAQAALRAHVEGL